MSERDPRPLSRRRLVQGAAAATVLAGCTVPPPLAASSTVGPAKPTLDRSKPDRSNPDRSNPDRSKPSAEASVLKSNTVRSVVQTVQRSPTQDGAGVKLSRILGSRALPMLDPFLMLDEFHSDKPEDYVRGFPSHPHRGFETVTIMLEGHVTHRDSVGNEGRISGGGVQWMTAGSGIIHSEMPEGREDNQEIWGYQLWINLPARLKMSPPRYQDLTGADIPVVDVADARVRVLAGQVGQTRGPVDGVAVAPTLLEARLEPGAQWTQSIEGGHHAFLYVVTGAASVGEAKGASQVLGAGTLGVLSPGDRVALSTEAGARALLFAAAPIGEPVARRGPFVMNTQAEIERAYDDYRRGTLVRG